MDKLKPDEIKELLENEWSTSLRDINGQLLDPDIKAEKLPYGTVEGKFSGTEVRMKFNQEK